MSQSESAVLHSHHARHPREVRDPYDGLRPWSAITHGIGAVLAVIGTVAMVLHWHGSPLGFLPFAVYGLSMFCLYLASTLYHCLRTGVTGRLALRKFDHGSIYLLIAGSYTPVCLTAMKDSGGPQMLVLVWIIAAAGIALTVCSLNIPRWLTSAIYLMMGWMAVFMVKPIVKNLTTECLVLLVAGGLLYTAGGILYAVKWPGRNNPRFGCHEIFHVFILLGSVTHFFLMYRLETLYG